MVYGAIVTGAAGFIGSHLVDFLLARDDVARVIAIDNFCPYVGLSQDETLQVKLSNLKHARSSPKFQLLPRDILDVDLALVASQMKAFLGLIGGELHILVFHLAASAGVRASIKDAKGYATNNVQATTHLLEGAADAQVCAFVLASSSSVYGNRPVVHDTKPGAKDAILKAFHEGDHTDLPISPYAATKKATELMAYTFHVNHGLPVACMRLFSVYGPRQRPDLAIHKFMRCILDGLPIDIYGDGTMERDYTYVADVVKGLWEAALAIPAHGYKVWNLGNSSPIQLLPLVHTIEEVVGLAKGSHPLNFLPIPEGDVARTCADVSEASYDFGYAPSCALKEGLGEEWTWLVGTKL